MTTLGPLLERLWQQYVAVTPQALRIRGLLEQQGETVVNDHIALRTYSLDPIGLDRLAAPFVRAGYQPRGSYRFVAKRLRARHYEHPDPHLPLVFVSELQVHELSPDNQQRVRALGAQLPRDQSPHAELPVWGRAWDLTYSDYEKLYAESEYAAWVAAYGFMANHFTVSVNHLRRLQTLEQVNQLLLDHGFRLNQSGGLIKGSPEQRLEQSSTMADDHRVTFAGETHRVPSCYYEFARRYPEADGSLFRGFIEGSADRIFESTNRGGAT